MQNVQIFPVQSQIDEKVNEDTTKLRQVAQKSDHVLLRISSIFPFDLFPDELIVDETKVSVISRGFLGTERIYSIPTNHVAEVIVETIPFFATLKLTDWRFLDRPTIIRFLKHSEALSARRIIQGLLLTVREGINLAHVANGDVSKTVEEAGKAHAHEPH